MEALQALDTVLAALDNAVVDDKLNADIDWKRYFGAICYRQLPHVITLLRAARGEIDLFNQGLEEAAILADCEGQQKLGLAIRAMQHVE